MGERHLTKAEAARHLGISTRTVERRLRAGALRATTVYGPHGPERRIVLPATPPDALDTAPVGGFGPPTAAPTATRDVAPVAPATDGKLLLAALAEAMREREALATRLGEERERRRAAEARLLQLETRAELQGGTPRRDTAGALGPLQRVWGLFSRWRGRGVNVL